MTTNPAQSKSDPFSNQFKLFYYRELARQVWNGTSQDQRAVLYALDTIAAREVRRNPFRVPRDYLVRLKLDIWETAVTTDIDSEKRWQDVLDQIAKVYPDLKVKGYRV